MMQWTDRHCRSFHRLLSRRARLYTEMITAEAILRGDRARLLGFGAHEHPLALQIGGAMPATLAEAAAIGADYGYDEINLNVGCPSDRVQEGRFGACLMLTPELVARSVAAMRARVRVPVTVKCRIGVDHQDAEEDLERFVRLVADAGCRTFIVHARKAWLQGLSPKENRNLPPLDWARVHRLQAAHRDLVIVLNGGIASIPAAERHLQGVGGVAVGRAAYQNPFLLAEVDSRLFGETDSAPTRRGVIEALVPYMDRHLAAGGRLNAVVRHILGLYNGQPRARAFRRLLSQEAPGGEAGIALVLEAMRIAEGAAATAERSHSGASPASRACTCGHEQAFALGFADDCN
jgi:tRNA-dihydrouridine synthase A